MNYQQARAYLEKIAAKGDLLGLDSIRALLEELDNPQDSLRFIHIAGTNGKGSVLAFLGSILKAAGYRVGRYSSPALFSYEEKIRVGEEPISRRDLTELTEIIEKARDRCRRRGLPETTIFEVETALSFLYFKKMRCDVVLLETGMGGRDDATNIVKTTLLEIFTPISLDHMQFLGATAEKIAQVKAGIIKKNTRVVSAPQEEGVSKVLKEACERMGASIRFVDPAAIEDPVFGLREQYFSFGKYKRLKIGLAGVHQMQNAALALEAAAELCGMGFPVTERQIRYGLSQAVWEGRFQLLEQKPAVVMDGAHNPGAARALMESVDQYFPGRRIFYIMGMFADKDYRSVLSITAGRAYKIFTVETKGSKRALPAGILAEAARDFCRDVTVVKDARKALERARTEADEEDVILIFGSLSFLWEIRDWYREAGERKTRRAVSMMKSLGWSNAGPGLARMRELLKRLGDPQKELACIHVAGSNGKGSVCAMLAGILQEAGMQTGLYISPHLRSFEERISVGGRPVSGRELYELTARVMEAVRDMEEKPNQFEAATAAAFLYFRETACEAVVLETGLGGEFDSTNVIENPVLSVITNLSLEHTQILGSDIESIAKAKAGIIKPGAAVVAYDLCGAAGDVIRETCREKKAELTEADFSCLSCSHTGLKEWKMTYRSETYSLGMAGLTAAKNAAVVTECVKVLRRKGFPVDEASLRRGLASCRWPCRFEVISEEPAVIADGAHNAQGAEELLRNLDFVFPGQKFIFIMGVLSDKDYAQMARLTVPFADRYFCVTPEGERALKSDELVEVLKENGARNVLAETMESASEQAVKLAVASGRPVVAFGSLHMVGFMAMALENALCYADLRPSV